MPFDGNGIYNPIGAPDFPAVSGTLIRASQYNNEILDIADALSNCITKDGQSLPTNHIPWNNKRITSLASAVNSADAVNLGQTQGLVDAAAVCIPMLRGFVLSSGGGSQTLNMGCDFAIQFWNPATRKIRVLTSNIVGKSINIGTAGPAANGRDQAAAFPAGSNVHLYFIYNPTLDVVATLASLTYGTPALPAGYTDVAYAGSVVLSGTNFLAMYGRGNTIYYNGSARILANGAATVATNVSAAAYIPTLAKCGLYNFIIEASFAGPGAVNVSGGAQGGLMHFALDAVIPSTPASARGTNLMELQLVNNIPGVQYSLSAAPSAGGVYIDVTGYRCFNGDC